MNAHHHVKPSAELVWVTPRLLEVLIKVLIKVLVREVLIKVLAREASMMGERTSSAAKRCFNPPIARRSQESSSPTCPGMRPRCSPSCQDACSTVLHASLQPVCITAVAASERSCHHSPACITAAPSFQVAGSTTA
eukprot:365169-Chlamydomonas_euryale.AAC.4